MNEEIPAEIDFHEATRGLHHIPPDAQVLTPALLSDVLSRDIEINEALK
jgi:hypothetical protein